MPRPSENLIPVQYGRRTVRVPAPVATAYLMGTPVQQAMAEEEIIEMIMEARRCKVPAGTRRLPRPPWMPRTTTR